MFPAKPPAADYTNHEGEMQLKYFSTPDIFSIYKIARIVAWSSHECMFVWERGQSMIQILKIMQFNINTRQFKNIF